MLKDAHKSKLKIVCEFEH